MRIDFYSFIFRKSPEKKGQFPTGSRVYKGFQGSGKTISMVKYAFDIKQKFPKCKIYSNVKLNGIEYQYFDKSTRGIEALRRALNERRGADGVLVLIDEAHLYFNKKTGIPLEVLTSISQQRKDRRRIVFSSQIWEELDISLRKQVKEIVTCHRFLFLEFNIFANGESLAYNNQTSQYEAKKLYTYIYKLSDKLFNLYDTYQRIGSDDKTENYARIESPSQQHISINYKGVKK